MVKKPPKAEIEAKVAAELKELGEKEPAEEKPKKEKEVVAGRKKPSYDIPITINQQVLNFIDYFQTRIPQHFRVYLERSGRYHKMMTAVLKKYGLPQDLFYLAMIESGFSCRAYSRAHAVGPWQFIQGTGKRYGLKINYWVDERRDPAKATDAAARYLKDLHAEFGSWYLAAAGYNAGEAKIRRALDRYDAANFWEISRERRRYLKRETKDYVPKMIAAAIIAKEPARYGFDNIKYQPPMAFDEVTVHPKSSLSVLAKLAGVKTDELRDLNPELRRWATPPAGMYKLRIPQGRASRFNTAYAKLAPSDRHARLDAVTVKIHRGDTLGHLAKEYGVSLQDLMAMNTHLDPRCLRIGQRVQIPPAQGRRSRSTRVASSRRGKVQRVAKSDGAKVSHVVKKGENLWLIAQAYGLEHRDIMRWNGMRTSRLMPGSELVLYVSEAEEEEAKSNVRQSRANRVVAHQETTHVVRKGQSLYSIAKRYGVSASDIKRWNGLSNNRILPGLKLKVRKPLSAAQAKAQLTQVAQVATSKRYTVQPGDTLWDISQRFNLSPGELKRLNNLRTNRITPGDVLRLR